MRSSQPPPLKKYRDLTGAETNRNVKSIKKMMVSPTSTIKISCLTSSVIGSSTNTRLRIDKIDKAPMKSS